jgi:hypothetical protein
MLDADLARLYGVQTKALNKAVRRNLERFPADFMMQLDDAEHRSLRFQFGTLKRGAHSKYPPLAFTREGIAMLSSILRSPRAVSVNIEIMRTFARLDRSLVLTPEAGLRAVRRRLDAHDLELGEHSAQLNELYARMKRRRLPIQ